MKALCPLCEKYTVTEVVWTTNGTYRCCRECLTNIPAVELCRILDHDLKLMWTANVRDLHYRIIARDALYICKRCAKEVMYREWWRNGRWQK